MTLFATADSATTARLHAEAPAGYEEDDTVDAKVFEALHIASERVRAKFGFACSQAMDQLAQIEHTAARFDTQPDAQVEVLAFHE